MMPADHGTQNAVEATQNSHRQTFEQQQRQRLVHALNLAPDDACGHGHHRSKGPESPTPRSTEIPTDHDAM